jgi:RNA polymerase sigma-70 factor (ECF subfamily)
VAQEVFLRAYRGLGRFRGQSSFKTWLYQIATNTARTHAAKRRSRPEEAVGSFGGGDPNEAPVAVSAEDLEASVVLRDRLDRALAALPEEQRQAIVLRDVEGFDYKEIAEMLSIPIGTVESRIFRARQRLRELLSM